MAAPAAAKQVAGTIRLVRAAARQWRAPGTHQVRTLQLATAHPARHALQIINAGQAKPSPPVGPALGQARYCSCAFCQGCACSALFRVYRPFACSLHAWLRPCDALPYCLPRVSRSQAGLNIMAFCKDFNARTQGYKARAAEEASPLGVAALSQRVAHATAFRFVAAGRERVLGNRMTCHCLCWSQPSRTRASNTCVCASRTSRARCCERPKRCSAATHACFTGREVAACNLLHQEGSWCAAWNA
jgi:hypothetical protein